MDIAERLPELVANPRETLDVEVKAWLDLDDGAEEADLAKALLALANHGGGFVLLGYVSSDRVSYDEAPNRPETLGDYNQDRVNGIVQKYGDPPFHCEVDLVERPGTGLKYPVIKVPPSRGTPVRARRDGPSRKHVARNSYYVRRPGPCSEPPQSADEWNRLIGRCVREAREDLLDGVRTLLLGLPSPPTPGTSLDDWIEGSLEAWHQHLDSRELPADHIARMPLGSYLIAYELEGPIPKVSLAQLKAALVSSEGHETGWPEWMMWDSGFLAPSAADNDTIECWTARDDASDSSDCDFWRVRRDGKAFFVRGLQEDDSRYDRAHVAFDVTIPIWRTGEALLHAQRLAENLGMKEGRVRMRVTWRGLAGRKLLSFDWMKFSPGGTSQRDEVTSEVSGDLQAVLDNLPEMVAELLEPLFAAFDFYQVPKAVVATELDKMRGRSPTK